MADGLATSPQRLPLSPRLLGQIPTWNRMITEARLTMVSFGVSYGCRIEEPFYGGFGLAQ
jgi:hypothetical protein